jgi:hypothetical protein
VRLVEPEVSLVVSKTGQALWMTEKLSGLMKNKSSKEKDSTPQSSQNLLNSITLDEIEIDKGSFHFQDLASGKTYSAEHIELNLAGETIFGPYDIDGSLTWNANQLVFEAKTGRFGDGQSLAVQSQIKLPSSQSKISFSGVIDYSSGIEIQGETSITTSDLSALMAAAGNSKPAEALKGDFSSGGIMTVSAQKLSYKNLTLKVFGVSAAGSLEFLNNKEKASELNIKLSSDSTLDIDRLMPGSRSGGGGQFIARSITSPKDVDIKMDLKLGAAIFNQQTLKYIQASVFKKGEVTKFKTKFEPAGGGSIESEGQLSFGSLSRSEKNGSVTYADPKLDIKSTVKSENLYELIKTFDAKSMMAKHQTLLSADSTLSLKAVIEPQTIDIKDSVFTLAKDAFAFNGKFLRNENERDEFSINLGTEKIDLDKYMKSGKEESGKGKNLQQTLGSINLPLDLRVNVAMKEAKIFETEFSRINIQADTKSNSLNITGLELLDKKENSLVLKGTIGDYKGLHDIDVILSGKTADAEALLRSLNYKPEKLPRIGTAEILTELKGHSDRLSFTANISALRGTAESSGTLTDLLGHPKFSDLTFRIKHPNYVQLGKAFNVDVKAGVMIDKNIDFFTSMAQTNNVYSFKELKANIGPMSMTGTITADLSAARPRVDASLQFGDMPLDDLLGHKAGSKGVTRASSSSSRQEVRWSREPIDKSFLHLLDLDLVASARSLKYGNWSLSNVAVESTLANGMLDVSKMNAGLYGGQLSMSGKIQSVQSPRDTLAMEMRVDARSVPIEPFVTSFSGSRLLNAKGEIFVDTTLKSNGLSPAALIFDLQGEGAIDGVNLVFEGFDLARLSRTLTSPSSSMTENFGALLNVTMGGGRTAFDTLASKYTIKEGVVLIDSLVLNGPDATITGLGNINLPLWTVDLETSIKLAEPADAPALKAVFKGPLDNPSQTFGKSALDAYFQSQLGNMIERSIIEKLEEKGVIKAPAKTAPAEQGGSTGSTQQPSSEEVRPEDVFMGILQNVIEGQ